MMPKTLVTPPMDDTSDLPRWWEDYHKLPSAYFTFDNSGRRQRLPPPAREVEQYERISEFRLEPGWSVVGYTLEPPFHPTYEAVAVMLECAGDRAWWHFRKW
uniref:Uncharacterized protein n=1 Tax=viral metagenome TaxID=1070528 RepID=A0A6M3LGG5_9ZZZZ